MADEARRAKGAARRRRPEELAELLAEMSGADEVAPPRPRPRPRPPSGPSARTPPAPPEPVARSQPTFEPETRVEPESTREPEPTVKPGPGIETTGDTTAPEALVEPDAGAERRGPPAVPRSAVVAGSPVLAGSPRPLALAGTDETDRASPAEPESDDRPRFRSRAAGRVGRREPARRRSSRRRRRPVKGRGLGARPTRSPGRRWLRLLAFTLGPVLLLLVILAVLGSGGTSPSSVVRHFSPAPVTPGVASTPLPAPPHRRHRARAAPITTPQTSLGGLRRILLVPAYFPPGALWSQAIAAEPNSTFIVNPASGPGAHPIPAFRRVVGAARHAGARLLAYVPTGAGRRSIADVEHDLDRYRTWYGLHDVLFDGAASQASFLGHYRTLADYARQHGAHQVVLNPGAPPDPRYFGIANAVVTFENSYTRYRGARFPSWLRHYPPSHQINIILGASTAADARDALTLARHRGAGVAYVTSGSNPNPYDTLPAYFDREAAWLKPVAHGG